jgi:zinc protease
MTIITMRPEAPAPEEKDSGPGDKPAAETLPELRTLKNGIRVILKGDESSFASSVCVYCRGGSSYEDSAHKGISFLTTEMLRKGTKRYSQKGLAEKVEMLGASLSPISGYNAVGMKLTVLNNSLEDAIPVLGEVILSPSFPEKELPVAKERTKDLIRKQQEEIFSFAVLAMRKKLFPGHPYGLSYYGTPETVDAVTLSGCKAHWARAIHPSQIVISAAGNFDKEKIFSLFEKTFGSIRPQGPVLKEEGSPAAILTGRFSEQFPAKQAVVLAGFRAPDYMSEQKYAYGFLDSFFSDQASPLFQSIRTEEGLAYATGSAYINGPFGGLFILYCATSPEKAPRVEEILTSEIRKFNEQGLTDEEYRSTWERFSAEHDFQYETPGARADTSAFDELYGLGFDNLNRFQDHAGKLNRETVNKILKEDFSPDRAVILSIVPGEGSAP